jgi:anti-sigma factor ChrR (cupin superfamily)
MQCEQVREQFADYLIDSIDEPVRFEIAAHLTACESCRTETDELKTLWTRLGSIPGSQPSPDARPRFDAMLDAYQHGLAHARSRSWWHAVNVWLGTWWPRQPALQFGFALGLLVAGVVLGRYGVQPAQTSAPNAEIAELRAELGQTRQMVALSLMQQQSASDRLKGVSWSYQLQQPGKEVVTALLDTLIHDANVNVRLATIDALRQFGDQPVVRRGVVDAMSRQESPMVQVALIDLAVDLHEKESVEALRQLSQNPDVNEAVRQRAQKGLVELE